MSSIILTTSEPLNGYLSLALQPASGTTIPGPGIMFSYGGSGGETLFDTTDSKIRLISGFEHVTAQFQVVAKGSAQGTIVLDQPINTDIILSSGSKFVVAVAAGQREGKFTLPVTGSAKIPIHDAWKHVQQLMQSSPQPRHSAESPA